MRIATWNCNSIRARLEYCLEWLGRDGVDILCLQETKSEDGKFPGSAFEQAGYVSEALGQKTYNGVAILHRAGLSSEPPSHGLGDEELDAQKRCIAQRIAGIDIVNVYVPNGRSIDHPDFALKLRFLERLRAILEERYAPGDDLVLCGDFNVAPSDLDVHAAEEWGEQVLCHPDERRALQSLLSWGLQDTFRRFHPEGELYSWWDYRGGAFRFNDGLRIDLILGSANISARAVSCEILREERKVKGKARLKPSDHAPVVLQLDA